jgi:hypothetical protein
MPWSDALKSLRDLQVDIIGCAETKIEWTDRDRQQAVSYAKCQFGHTTIATSNSDYSVGYKHQPGGTAMILTKNTSSRYHSKINDPSGLGRWSGFKLYAKENKYIHIITAYRPHVDTKHDSSTTFQQQIRLLQNSGVKNPDPQLILNDLAKFVKKISKEGSVILMWDANLLTQERELQKFQQDSGLVSLVIQPPPQLSTYARGQKVIDHIMGTFEVTNGKIASGYFPMYESPWHSDHQAIYVDLNGQNLFRNSIDPIVPNIPRRLNSKNRKHIIRFLEKVEISEKIPTILRSLRELKKQDAWAPEEHTNLESIDQEFTQLLVETGQSLSMQYNTPWSPTIDKAFKIHKYWKQKTSRKLNRIRNIPIITQLEQELGNDLYMGNPARSFYGQLVRSSKMLNKAQRNATTSRIQYLNVR